MIFKMWILLSPTNLNTTGCPKKNSSIFSIFFQYFLGWVARLSCHLWTQFFQLLKGQFGKFVCPPHRELPDVFETPPSFLPSPFQSGVIAKKTRSCVFFGTPCTIFISPNNLQSISLKENCKKNKHIRKDEGALNGLLSLYISIKFNRQKHLSNVMN